MGQAWEGRPDKGAEPWRDTGIEVIGPAVAHLERSFASMWELAGGESLEVPHHTTAPAGDVHLRVIPTEPFSAALLRTDLALKSSGGDSRVLVERLIVELTGRPVARAPWGPGR